MASDDDYPEHWSRDEIDLWEDFTEYTDARMDQVGQELFDSALFDFDGTTPDSMHDFREALQDYMLEMYDLDLSEDFDWDGYRDWYDGQ